MFLLQCALLNFHIAYDIFYTLDILPPIGEALLEDITLVLSFTLGYASL
jgi:hypothetical protein